MAFIATAEHIAAMHACDAWNALCESNGDQGGAERPPHVVAAMVILDALEESELDVVFEASRPFPQRAWAARDGSN